MGEQLRGLAAALGGPLPTTRTEKEAADAENASDKDKAALSAEKDSGLEAAVTDLPKDEQADEPKGDTAESSEPPSR